MLRQDYFPSRLADQPEWLGNYARRVLEFGPTLGLSTAAINATVADALYLKYVIGDWLTEVRRFGPACTQALKSLESGTGTLPFCAAGLHRTSAARR